MGKYIDLFPLVRVLWVITLFEIQSFNYVECSSVNLCQFRIHNEENNEFVYFDFSRLPDSDFTADYFADDDLNPLYTAYLSFCGQRENLPCRDDIICVKNISSAQHTFFGAGSSLQDVHYISHNQSIIHLTGGTSCKDGKNFSSFIHLHCESYDRFPAITLFEECTLSLAWFTTAACPTKKQADDVTELCIIDNDYIRSDLQLLHHSAYYSVPLPDGLIYQINVCGPIKNGSCSGEPSALCMIYSNGTTIPIYSDKINFYFNSSNFKLTAVYQNAENSTNKGAYVDFVCDKNVVHGDLKYSRHEKSVPVFEMKTELACISFLDNCSFYDGDHFYYLSPLLKINDSWEVVDNDGNLYFFRICSLFQNPLLQKNLADKPMALFSNAKSNSTINLGSKILQPKSDLTLVYIGGTPCEENDSIGHSLNLKLVCSKEQGKPEFKNISKCGHYLEWSTPAACPVKIREGSECKVREPYNEYEFNLSELTSLDELVVPDSTEKYLLNICHPIKSSCGSKNDVCVCWLDKTGKSRAIGKSSSNLKFKNGMIELKMHGDACRPGGPSSTVIISFICEHELSISNYSGLQLKNKNDQRCLFNFVWRTEKACFKRTISKCSVSDEEGHVYDLSPLRKTGSNYVIPINGVDYHGKIILNVCHSVINEPGVTCKYNDGICFFNTTKLASENRFFSLGIVKSGPYFENGILKLTYKDGAICTSEETFSAEEITSIIEFQCSLNDSEPKFISHENCVYKFVWKTKVACPSLPFKGNDEKNSNNEFQSILRNEKVVVELPSKHLSTRSSSTTDRLQKSPYFSAFSKSFSRNVELTSQKSFKSIKFENNEFVSERIVKPTDDLVDCYVTNPFSNYRFDLKPLSDRDWLVKNNGGRNITVSVCRPLKFSEPIGCLVNEKNYGNANTNLKYYDEGHLLLYYSTSDLCNSNNSDFSFNFTSTPTVDLKDLMKTKGTIIHFKCSTETNEPYLLEHPDNCFVNIIWETPHACEIKNNCSRWINKDIRELDVLSLIENKYRIFNGSDEFIVNICEKVVLNKNVYCRSEKNSSCATKKYESMNLGVLMTPPEFVSSKNLLLKYIEGDICPQNSSVKLSSQINLVCDNSVGKGQLLLHDYSEKVCQYSFIWRTDSVCLAKSDNVPVTDCLIFNDFNEQYVNLSNVIEKFVKNSDKRGKKFKMDLCQINNEMCPKGIICHSNNKHWLIIDKFNDLHFHLSSHKALHYSYPENCSEYSIDHFKNIVNQLYCGVKIPPTLSLTEKKIMKRCVVLLEDFDLRPCLERNEETRAVLSDENWTYISFLAVIGILMLCCVIFLIFRRKIRQIFAKYWRSSNSGGRSVKYRRPDELAIL